MEFDGVGLRIASKGYFPKTISMPDKTNSSFGRGTGLPARLEALYQV
jgi:hypothetical protein